MNVAQVIKDARLRAGLTSQELADRASTSKTAVSEIENGRRGVTVGRFDRLLASTGSQCVIVPSKIAPTADCALDAAVALTVGDNSRAYRLVIDLADQLMSVDPATRVALCITPPRSTGSRVHDAAIAGVVEYCLDGLPKPMWLAEGWRTLDYPQPLLEGLVSYIPAAEEIPSALRKHGVLIDESSLRGV